MTYIAVADLSTGFVTTTRITHATPAPLFASVADRLWENDAKLTSEARYNGCDDVASQLVRPGGPGNNFNVRNIALII